MFGNLAGPTLIVFGGLILVVAIIVLVVIVIVKATKKPSHEDAQRAAFEEGKRQAELQRAYEAGLNSGDEPSSPTT